MGGRYLGNDTSLSHRPGAARWGLYTPRLAQVKISALPGATALSGPEIFPCDQGGTTSGCTATQIQTFASGGAIASGDLLANTTGGSANAIGVTGSAWLDKAFDNTEGDLCCYRGVSLWAYLSPGSNGQPLLSGGPSAIPSFGTLGIGAGGTGQTTKGPAFNALSPMSTEGDLEDYTGGSAARLAVGTACQAVQSNGTDPIYSANWCTIDRTTDNSATTNSTTLTNDSVLTFSVAANTSYRFHAVVFIDETSSATGYEIGINGPASPTSLHFSGFLADSNFDTGIPNGLDTSFGSLYGCSSSCHAYDYSVTIDGVLQNGSNAGSVAVAFSQGISTSTAGPVIRAGSWIAYSKL